MQSASIPRSTKPIEISESEEETDDETDDETDAETDEEELEVSKKETMTFKGLPYQTKKEADDERKEYKDDKNNIWIQKFMKNNNFKLKISNKSNS